jgi:hypothetical protein
MPRPFLPTAAIRNLEAYLTFTLEEDLVMSACFTYGAAPLLLENAVQIAMDYLQRAGEIDDYAETCQFLVDEVEFRMKQGQRHKLVLANRAISAFEQKRSSRTLELSAASG